MISKDMQATCQRLVILGVLSMCLFYFGYADKTEKVLAAACIQECEASENQCQDSCRTSCSEDSTDEDCNSCVTSCRTSFQSCMRHAVFCRNADEPPAPTCQTYYGGHCPIIGGTADCTDPSAHNGYFQICNTIGGQQCVECPDHEVCVGSNGLPPCPHGY